MLVTGDTTGPHGGGLLGSAAQQRAEGSGQRANFRSDRGCPGGEVLVWRCPRPLTPQGLRFGGD